MQVNNNVNNVNKNSKIIEDKNKIIKNSSTKNVTTKIISNSTNTNIAKASTINTNTKTNISNNITNSTKSNISNNITNSTKTNISNTTNTTTNNTTTNISNNTTHTSTKGPKNVFSTAIPNPNPNASATKTTATKAKMDKLKMQGKSLLLGGPKKECTICHKYIESHLHQIHVNAHPSQIFKWMYLGNFDTACNISDLRRLGINYVLNVAAECKNTLLPKSTEQLHLKMKDLADFEVIDYFEKANEFFNKVRNSGGIMLVHCKYGVSRSPSFVAAYLMKYYGFSVDSALNYIRKKRPQINPNEGFLRQLELYEQTFKTKGKK